MLLVLAINEIDVADDSIAAKANVFRVTAFINSNRLDPRKGINPRLLGVVLNSTSRREAKRGQSTNRKGEMSRNSHYKAKEI